MDKVISNISQKKADNIQKGDFMAKRITRDKNDERLHSPITAF